MARFEIDAVLGRLEALENLRESRRNVQHDLSRTTVVIIASLILKSAGSYLDRKFVTISSSCTTETFFASRANV